MQSRPFATAAWRGRKPAIFVIASACGLAIAFGAAAQAPGSGSIAAPAAIAPRPADRSVEGLVSEVVIAGSRLNLLGVATTASQGSITQEELQLRPVYRVGQLLETTPSWAGPSSSTPRTG